MPPRSLVDSSFLYALYATADPNHEEAQALADLLGGSFVLLTITLVEAAFLFRRKGGVPAVMRFLDDVYQANFEFDTIQQDDLPRIQGIMGEYPALELDFVDASLITYTERQGIRRVCTYDYRDFSVVRPAHVAALILLPLQYDQL